MYHLYLKKATSKQKKMQGINLKNDFFPEFVHPVTGRLCKTDSLVRFYGLVSTTISA